MSEGAADLRIFLSRSPSQANKFTDPLKNSPCTVHSIPVIETNLWKKPENVEILNHFDEFDWVFFTSAKGVRFFQETTEWLEWTMERLHAKKIAAVGTGTAAALKDRGYSVDFIPSTFDAEHLGREFLDVEQPKKILLIKGELSRTTMDEKFKKHAIDFENMYVYRTVTNDEVKDQLNCEFQAQPFDYYVFTSPSSIHAFFELLDIYPENIFDQPCFCIGRTTEYAALNAGFKKTFIPEEYTLQGLATRVRQVIEEAKE